MLSTVLTTLSAGYLAAALLGLAKRKPGYSHFRHTISELGETGARDQNAVAFAVFLPVGLALLVVAWLAGDSASAALALCIAIGYLGAALFPCDPGSPLSGSTRQALHNLAGAVEYIGGGFALMTIAREHGELFKFAGYLVLAAAIGLSILPANAGRGLLQRIAEICLFASLAMAVSVSAAAG